MQPKDIAAIIDDCLRQGKRIHQGRILSAANTGGKVQVELPEPLPGVGRVVNAIAGNDCLGGQAVILRADDGTWYALSTENQRETISTTVVTSRRRQAIATPISSVCPIIEPEPDKELASHQLKFRFKTKTAYSLFTQNTRGKNTCSIDLTKKNSLPAFQDLCYAFLYWNMLGSGLTYNHQIKVDGSEVQGDLVGISGNTCWSDNYNQTYRADITKIIKKDVRSVHKITELKSEGTETIDGQGVALLLLYASKDKKLVKDIYVYDGGRALSGGREEYTQVLQDEEVKQINMLVSDCQNFGKLYRTLNSITIGEDNTGKGFEPTLYLMKHELESKVIAKKLTFQNEFDCVNWFLLVMSS